MPSRTKRPATKSTKKGGAARGAKKAGGSTAGRTLKKSGKKSAKKSSGAKKSSAIRASAKTTAKRPKATKSAKAAKSVKSSKAAKRRPAAGKRRPAEKSLGTKIVETAQAAGSWVADTAKELVDKGANLIKPSEPGGSAESSQASAPNPSRGFNGHDAADERKDSDEESNEVGEAPQPMKDDD